MINLFDFLVFSVLFSTVWSSIFTIVFILALIISASYEEVGFGYFILAIYLAFLAMFTPFNPFVWAWSHPSELLSFLIIYFMIGAVYSIIKYWSFVKKMVKMVKDIKIRFIEFHELSIESTDEIPNGFKADWKPYKILNLSYRDRNILENGLTPANNKALITYWIAFWPFSAISLFINDPLKHLVNAVYDAISTLYRKTYEKLVSKYINVKDI